jgi:hypothetical protein
MSQAEVITDLVKANERLTLELIRLRKALRFYADEDRYCGPNQRPREQEDFGPDDFCYLWDVSRDRGEIARAALKGKP